MRVSHGCIRLYPEDIAALFQLVQVGTKVNIVNQPYKIGERNQILYLEVHPLLSEDKESEINDFSRIVEMVIKATQKGKYLIDWELIKESFNNPTGVPVAIGVAGV